MCFGEIGKFLFGGGEKAPAPQAAVNTPPPAAPAAPPAPVAPPPAPNQAKSDEMEKSQGDKTGFGALIIPRTALGALVKNVPG